MKDFGFGKKTGIDLQGKERGSYSRLTESARSNRRQPLSDKGFPSRRFSRWRPFRMTINGGTLYTPFIAKEWVDPVTKKPLRNNRRLRKGKLFPRKRQSRSDML
ncbi:hypothetical protein QNN00_20415 [Bacillus velezensis]|nr:hypothetical protein [Bacillus velezensis]